jgi:hypothetical protein
MLAWQNELNMTRTYSDTSHYRPTEMGKRFQQVTTPRPEWLQDAQADTLVLFPIFLDEQNSQNIYDMLRLKFDGQVHSRMFECLWMNLPSIAGTTMLEYNKQFLKTNIILNNELAVLAAKQLGKIPCIISGTVFCCISAVQHATIKLTETWSNKYIVWPFYCEKCDAEMVKIAAKNIRIDELGVKLQLCDSMAASTTERAQCFGVDTSSNDFMALQKCMRHFDFLLSEEYSADVHVAYMHSIARYIRHGLLDNFDEDTRTLLDGCFEYSKSVCSQVRSAVG